MSLGLDTSSWQTATFGAVVDRVRELRSPNAVLRYVAGGHFDEGALEVRRWGTPDDGGMGSTFTYAFRPGDTLFVSASWYLRKVAVASFEGVVADKTYVMRPRDPQVLDPRFLPWVLVTDRFQAFAAAQSTGSMNARLLWTTLTNYPLHLPPLGEQRRIAELLDAIEAQLRALAELRQELERTRRVLREVTFADWENRFPCAALSQLFDFQLGKMVSGKSSPTPADPGLAYLGNIDVQWSAIDLTNLRRIRLTDRERAKFRLEVGDVLVCEGRGVGRSAVWRGELDECYYQKALHRLRPRPDTPMASETLVEFLKWHSETNGFRQLVGDSLIPHLTEVKFRTLTAPIPDAGSERALLDALAEFSDAERLLNAESSRVTSLRNGVLKEVFGA